MESRTEPRPSTRSAYWDRGAVAAWYPITPSSSLCEYLIAYSDRFRVDQETGEELPDREAMSLINGNVAAPINAAVGLNALSDHSVAAASATQNTPITQSN